MAEPTLTACPKCGHKNLRVLPNGSVQPHRTGQYRCGKVPRPMKNQKSAARPSGVKVHRGVAYFATYGRAEECRGRVSVSNPEARIVLYELGYAVQYRISGPYYPELEGA